MKSRLIRAFWIIGGLVAFAVFTTILDQFVGIPFEFSYHVGCSLICLSFMAILWRDYPDEQWSKKALIFTAILNLGILFWPLSRMPSSRGDVMFFAVPDAVVTLALRIYYYPVMDVHQRAVRQQMIFALVLALAVCAGLLAVVLLASPRAY